jgi:RND family efflux transporter MFP subunit
MIKTSPFFLTVSSGLLVMTLVACSGKTEVAPATAPVATASAPVSAASAPAAPVTVTTVRAVLRDFPVLIKATGTVTPLTSVDVRAQVTSIVKQVHFKEGQFVKAGTLLFTLDSRTDEANLAKARAQLAKDQAALADAKRQFARAQQLLAQNFISQGALDSAQTQVEAQLATVAADQAAIEATRVALSFGRITAQNSGRAGAVNVFAGSAVQANVTPLVTITQLDPIAVAYSLPQRHLPDALLALKAGGAAVVGQVPEGGTFNGHLQFVDNAVDPNSGTIKVKAVFDNRDGQLWPGAFIEVSQTANTLKDAVVVPQAALIQAARGTVVYAVEEGRAVSKPVQLLTAQNGDAAVTGIKAGDVIVLDGRQNLRPGTPVVERAKTKATAP